MKDMKKEFNKGLTCGLCIGIAHMLREGHNSIAVDIWRGAGLTIKECEEVVDEYDLNELLKHQKELM